MPTAFCHKTALYCLSLLLSVVVHVQAQPQWLLQDQQSYTDTLHTIGQEVAKNYVSESGQQYFQIITEKYNNPFNDPPYYYLPWDQSYTLQAYTWQSGQWKAALQTTKLEEPAYQPTLNTQLLISEDGKTLVTFGLASQERKVARIQVFDWKQQQWQPKGNAWTDTLYSPDSYIDPQHLPRMYACLSQHGQTIAVAYKSHYIRVRQWNAKQQQWQQKGTAIRPPFQDQETGVNIQLSKDGHTLAVLTLDYDAGWVGEYCGYNATCVSAYRWNNGQWQALVQNIDEWTEYECTAEGHPRSDQRAMALSGDGNSLATLYLSEEQNGQPKLKVYTWAYLGGDSILLEKGQPWKQAFLTNNLAPAIALSNDGKRLAVLQQYQDEEGRGHLQATVAAWKQGRWQPLGQPIDLGEGGLYPLWQMRFAQQGAQLLLEKQQTRKDGFGQYTVHQFRVYQLTSLKAPPSFASLSLHACQNYQLSNGQIITQSGTYQDTLVNHYGGDSILTLELTITQLDRSLQLQNAQLMATEVGATYQWYQIDKNLGLHREGIQGANQRFYHPLQSGNYLVRLSKGGCHVFSKALYYHKK